MKKIICFTLFIAFISACTATRDIDVLQGAPELPPDFQTFEINPEFLPAFLGPALVSNFAVALAEKGYEPVVEDGDVVISLRLEQEQIGPEAVELGRSSPRGIDDDFAEELDTSSETRFIAKIVVEVRMRGDAAVQWTGSIQRLHTVRAGDYMHMGPASGAFLSAFRALLQDFPVQTI